MIIYSTNFKKNQSDFFIYGYQKKFEIENKLGSSKNQFYFFYQHSKDKDQVLF